MSLTEHQKYVLNELEIPIWLERVSDSELLKDISVSASASKLIGSETVSGGNRTWEVVEQTGDNPSLCWLISKSGRLPDEIIMQNFITALNLSQPHWLVLKSHEKRVGALTSIPEILSKTEYTPLILIQLDDHSRQPEIIEVNQREILICKVEDFERIEGKRKLWACVQTLIK